MVILKIGATTYVVLDWLNEYYEIRSDRFIHRKGIFSRKDEEYPFVNIESVKLSQGFIGRLFNYGTLELFEFKPIKYRTMYLIHNPARYLHILESLMPEATVEKEVPREHLIREKGEE